MMRYWQVGTRRRRAWQLVMLITLAASHLIEITGSAIAQEYRPLQELPVWAFGNSDAKNKVTFIWSTNCAACQQAFANSLTPLYREHTSKRDLAVRLVQYGPAAEILEYVCDGHELYTSKVLKYLAAGNYDVGIKDSPLLVNACPNRVESSRVVGSFESQLASVVEKWGPLPIMLMNGNPVQLQVPVGK